MRVVAVFGLVAALSVLGHGSVTLAGPVPLIIDTDLSGDASNYISVNIGHVLMDRGEVELLAMMVDTGHPEAVGGLSVASHFFNHDQIPLAAYKGEHQKDFLGPYVSDLLSQFDSPIRNYTQVPEGHTLYRQVLAAQPDHSVFISATGFLSNLHLLLLSPPDEFSPLNGADLVAQKVKQLAVMGGNYQTPTPECNFVGDPAATFYVTQNWPASVPIVYSGFELGSRVLTGSRLITNTNCPASTVPNPFKVSLVDLKVPIRESWDSVTTLFSVRGAEGFYSLVPGHNVVDPATGVNTWDPATLGKLQSYMLLNETIGVGPIEQIIDDLICTLPTARVAPRLRGSITPVYI